MNRSPAFQFYPADWFDFRVTRMSYEAQGIYMRILAYMWKDSPDQCSLLNDDKMIAKSLGISISKWKKNRTLIFQKGDPILLENETHLISLRLQHEALKQKQYRELQSKKGNLSVQARFNRGSTVVQPEGQPNGNQESTLLSSSSSSSSNINTLASSHVEEAKELPPVLEPAPVKKRISHDYSENFETWWDMYPKTNGAKKNAWEVWEKKRKAGNLLTLAEMCAGIYYETSQNEKWKNGYIVYAERWLKSERYVEAAALAAEMLAANATAPERRNGSPASLLYPDIDPSDPLLQDPTETEEP